MAVCRLIFRLDFKLCYDIIDSPGSVMRLIDKTTEGFWSEMRESKHRRGVEGRFLSEDGNLMRLLTVEPNAIIATFETVEGVDFANLPTDESFVGLQKLANKVCEEYKIDLIRRAGIRTMYFNKLGAKDAVYSAFRKFISSSLLDNTEDTLGRINDYALVFDGDSDAGYKYHLTAGPLLSQEEMSRYFDHIGSKFVGKPEFDFICDLDLYEQDFSLSKIPLTRWFRPMIEKNAKLVEHIENQLKEQMDA